MAAFVTGVIASSVFYNHIYLNQKAQTSAQTRFFYDDQRIAEKIALLAKEMGASFPCTVQKTETANIYSIGGGCIGSATLQYRKNFVYPSFQYNFEDPLNGLQAYFRREIYRLNSNEHFLCPLAFVVSLVAAQGLLLKGTPQKILPRKPIEVAPHAIALAVYGIARLAFENRADEYAIKQSSRKELKVFRDILMQEQTFQAELLNSTSNISWLEFARRCFYIYTHPFGRSYASRIRSIDSHLETTKQPS